MSLCNTVVTAQTTVETELTCAQITIEISQLIREKDALQRSYWAVPGNQVAAVGATTFTYAAIPSIVYLAATGIERLPDYRNRLAIQTHIDALREKSAQAQCYVVPIYHY